MKIIILLSALLLTACANTPAPSERTFAAPLTRAGWYLRDLTTIAAQDGF